MPSGSDCGGCDCRGLHVCAAFETTGPHPIPHPRPCPLGPTVEGATGEDVTATAWIFWSICSSMLHQRRAFIVSPTRVNLYSLELPPSVLILLEMGLGRCRRVCDEYPTLRLHDSIPAPRQEHISSWSACVRVGGRTLVGRRGHRLEREPGLDARAVEWPLASWRPWALGITVHASRCADAATCLERGWDASHEKFCTCHEACLHPCRRAETR